MQMQFVSFMFTSNTRIGNKNDDSDFDHGIGVDTKLAGLI